MEAQRIDRTYGMIVGGAIGDAYGLAAERVMGQSVRLVSPVDPPIQPEQAGRWGESTQLLLFYVDYFAQLNEDAVAYYKNQRPYVASPRSLATVALGSVGAAALFHSTDYARLLLSAAQHGRLFEIDPTLAKLWAAVLDGAYHGAPKAALTRLETYANIEHIEQFTEKFLALSDGKALLLSADEDPASTVFAALCVFSCTSSYVEAMRLAVNGTVAPLSVGVLVGQLCGCYHGLTDIPERWVAAVHGKHHLRNAVRQLPYGVQRPAGRDAVLSQQCVEGSV